MLKDNSKKIEIHYILNAPVLPNCGLYKFTPFSRSIQELNFSKAISAVGHETTAIFLSHLLKTPINTNRIRISMKVGNKALVFRLKERLAENKILSLAELRKMPFELCILERIE